MQRHPMFPVSERRPDTSPPVVSRRTALAGLGAGGLGIALAATVRPSNAQDVATEMANHPLVGTWLAGTGPNDLGLVHWDADGNQDFQSSTAPTTSADGVVTYNDTAMGVWEPVDDRGIHITFTWATRDETGAVIGTTTVDGFPVASEDGMSFVDDGTKVIVTQSDPQGVVTQVIEGVPPVFGVRAVPGHLGYVQVLAMIAANAAATPAAGTPAS